MVPFATSDCAFDCMLKCASSFFAAKYSTASLPTLCGERTYSVPGFPNPMIVHFIYPSVLVKKYFAKKNIFRAVAQKSIAHLL
jgi:hypothetical protein